MDDYSHEEIRVRQYKKSLLPRLRWIPELHDQFVEAVHNLGGKYKATPKKIMQMMSVRGIKISHIKSHLQMYRNMKAGIDLNGLSQPRKKPKNSISLRDSCESLRGPSSHHKRIRKLIIKKGFENDFIYQMVGHGGNENNNKNATKSSGGVMAMAYLETQVGKTSEMNILGLGNNQSSHESCGLIGPINLDLTMASSY